MTTTTAAVLLLLYPHSAAAYDALVAVAFRSIALHAVVRAPSICDINERMRGIHSTRVESGAGVKGSGESVWGRGLGVPHVGGWMHRAAHGAVRGRRCGRACMHVGVRVRGGRSSRSGLCG
eukprot:GHVU01098028.1.p2 GENE.GHVU01098028.1~~GHVU01098028.1.p2  ORF type:complete len:121 (+),score=0.07 GHVU01098028.1:391-753(+)